MPLTLLPRVRVRSGCAWAASELEVAARGQGRGNSLGGREVVAAERCGTVHSWTAHHIARQFRCLLSG